MKTCRILTILFLGLLACQRQEQPVTPDPDPVTDPVPDLVKHTLYASTPGEDAPETRTQISVMDDKKVVWTAHESISILAGEGNYAFEGDNDGPAASATFTGMGPADLGSYIALYPYDASATYAGGYVSTSLPAVQTGKAGSFADGYLITADDATGNSISFNHVCSGLRFKVNSANIKSVSIRGNNGERIAGDFRFRFASEDTPVAEAGSEDCVTLTAPDTYFDPDKYYYIVILPTVFSRGFTLTADNNGTQIGELRFYSSVTFSAGKFKTIKNSTTEFLDERMTWSPPKSQVYYGPQNSFCLRPSESITIDVSPRKIYGPWQRSGLAATGADAPTSAEVLWGGGEGGSVASASVVSSKLTITASSTPGSALVAIKKGETILWSYLIWVTESAPAETTLPGGAVIQSTLGGNCYFQWGRKDPLLDGCTYVENQGDNGLIYSIQHPNEYINGGSNTSDWFTNNTEHPDNNLWGGSSGSKTVWDPCPAGWRVPKETDFYETALTELTVDYAASFDKFGLLVPDGASELAKHNDDYGWFAYCWTREPSGTSSKSLLMKTDGYGFKGFSIEGDARYVGLSVRCVKE